MSDAEIKRFAAVTRVFVDQVAAEHGPRGASPSPSEPEFEAAYLYIVEGRGPAEIARHQGIKVKTIERHLVRFRVKCGLQTTRGSSGWFPMRCAYWRAVGHDEAAAELVPVAVASIYWRAVGLVEAEKQRRREVVTQ